jgi:hypothetical protein
MDSHLTESSRKDGLRWNVTLNGARKVLAFFQINEALFDVLALLMVFELATCARTQSNADL